MGDPMPGKITIQETKPKVVPYAVQGDTLAEIWSDIQAKGPKDEGKSRAGYTTAPVKPPAQYAFDGKVKSNKSKGEFEVEVWIKTGVFKMSSEIQAPSLKSDKALSAKAKKEWKRFEKALMAHEQEHVAATRAAARKFADELLALKGKGVHADKEQAKKLAAEDFNKQQAKKHDDAAFKKRLKDANKKLDAGGHGPVLDTSIA